MTENLLNNCLIFAHELIDYSDKLIGSFPQGKEERISFSIVIYFKILNMFQGIIVLFENNLYQPAEQLLRCCIETTCILLLNIKDDDFINKYDSYEETYQELQRLKTLKSIGETEINGVNINREIKRIEQRIKVDSTIINLTSNYLLKNSGLHKEFKAPYYILSESVHSNVRDITRHLMYDDKGIFIGACSHPFLNNTNKITMLLTTNRLMILCLKNICSFFNLTEFSEKNISIEQKFEGLDNELSLIIRPTIS